jgi:peptide/nickel transport system permease protein
MATEQLIGASRSGFRSAWRALPTKAKVGALLIATFIFVAIAGPYLAPYDYSATIATATAASAPSLAHLLGTTSTGQDVLSQLLVGTRSTVVIGLLAGAIATFFSVVIGVSAGFLGGLPDEGLSLLSNVFLVLPALPLLIVIFGYLPLAGNIVIAFVLSLLGWPWGARVIRAQTLSLRNRDFVSAARETGEHTWRVIFFEVLPNEVSLIAASFVGTVLYAVLSSVGLAFLGFGVGGSSWSLGTMLYWVQNQDAIEVGSWWWYAPPGICVALFGMGLVLMNFGLDELGNPKLRAATHHNRINGHAWRLPDPTPVVHVATPMTSKWGNAPVRGVKRTILGWTHGSTR